MRAAILIACVLLTGVASGQDARQTAIEPNELPSLISSIRVEGPLEFCGEPVPLDIPDVRERLEKELLLALWDRPQVILWLKRSQRYFPLIEPLLAENNLPPDLKYVAIIESALRPHAGSSKGAIGFWQFVAATGRKYALEITEDVDQRRNVFASTRAAARYFKTLHSTLGSWTLAAAAFNMGEEGLAAEIISQKTDDYYRLYLPLETQRFVFRILSAKLIFSDPVRYGFRLNPADYYQPLSTEPVEVVVDQRVPIHIVAQAGKTYFKMIKDLNPEIRGHHLAAGKHRIQVPQGGAAGFRERFEKSFSQWQARKAEAVYVVQQGDSLYSIAMRHGVPLPALLIWNRINLNAPIHPGDRLIIFQDSEAPEG